MKKLLIGLLIFGGVILLGVVGCVALVGGVANEVSKDLDEAKGAEHKVTYEVGGSAKRADITYSSDGSTGTAQENGVKVPWTKKVTVTGEVLPVFQVLAQNKGGGTITCTITVDGEVVKENRSRGEFAIASCDATLD